MVRSMTFQTLTCGIRQNEASAPNGEIALSRHSWSDDRPITSMQDYKTDTPLDAHQHAPNAHLYWIPGNMMLNAISGIAPIS